MNLIVEWLAMKGKQQNKSDEEIENIIHEVLTKCKELGLNLD